MPVVALALLLSAAVAHATWNYFAKGASGSVAFVFTFCVVARSIPEPSGFFWPGSKKSGRPFS